MVSKLTNSGGGSRKGVHRHHQDHQQQQQRDDHMMLAPPPQLLHLIMAEGGELKVSACEKYRLIKDWPPFLLCSCRHYPSRLPCVYGLYPYNP